MNTDYHQVNTLEINNITLHSDFSYTFTIRDGNDQLKYRFLDLPESGGDISLEYSYGFLVYDNVLEIDLPEHKGYNSTVLARNWNTNYQKELYMSIDNFYGQNVIKLYLAI